MRTEPLEVRKVGCWQSSLLVSKSGNKLVAFHDLGAKRVFATFVTTEQVAVQVEPLVGPSAALTTAPAG